MSRLQALWLQVRDSLWFLPSLMTVAAMLLAFGLVELDRRVVDAEYIGGYFFVFGAGSDGARGMLSAIAQSTMTVTGVVFSVTIIALQLASTQFTPRVLVRFTNDRGNQVVLGIFIATFTYALLVLRVVRRDDEFVPAIAITVAIVLALVAVGAIIYFIDHVANSLKAETVIARVVEETTRVIERVYPRAHGGSGAAALPYEPEESFAPEGQPAALIARASGFLQGIDQPALSRAVGGRLTIEMRLEIGDFIIEGEPLARVWPAAALEDEDTARRLRSAFLLGGERTPQQDVQRGLIELVDIAVKALSPSIYEPTTAVACIHRIGELLVAIGNRAPPRRHRSSEDGRVRFILEHGDFEAAVRLAVRPIRRYGEDQAAILIKLLDTLGRVGALVPEARRAPLAAEVEETLARAEARIESRMDRAEIQAEAERALDRMGRSP
jgi:uncharacterized membrane protein